MTGIFTGIAVLLAAAIVYRICKRCWRSTEHYKFDDTDGTTTYKCVDCGFSYKEETKKDV